MGTRETENKVLDVIKNEMDRVDYGKITIIKNKTSDFIDVVTEHRQRINKTKFDSIKDVKDPLRKG